MQPLPGMNVKRRVEPIAERLMKKNRINRPAGDHGGKWNPVSHAGAGGG